MSIDNIEYIRISPGIGMARVGNSDIDFIGPETPGIPPAPQNGLYKDSEQKVKPMSSRFRVYGYNADGEAIMELNMNTPGVTALEWTVHMANKKAANYAFQGKFGFNSKELRNPNVQPDKSPDQRDQLIIDPGPITISGLNTPRAEMTANIFDGKTNGPIQGQIPIPTSNILGKTMGIENYGNSGMTEVTYNPLAVTIGWLKTDSKGRLVIVGGRGDAGSLTSPSTIIQKGPGTYTSGDKSGKLNQDPNSNGNLYFNNPGWYDDTGGGSVNASVTFTNSGGTVTLTSTGTQTLSNKKVIEEKNKRAWVGVAPPKFVPSMKNVVSLADLQYNIFREKAPGAGSLLVASSVSPFTSISLYDSATGSNFIMESIAQSTGTEGAPLFNSALTTFNRQLYCAYVTQESRPGVNNRINLAISKDPKQSNSYNYYPQSSDVFSDNGPALTVFNGKVLCAVVANNSSSPTFKNKVVIGQTTGTSFTFNPISFMLATPTGLQDFDNVPAEAVALSAYNGNLYMAFNFNGDNYLGVPSTAVAFQFNLQKVGQAGITSNHSPSIAAFDDRLYYAITDSSNSVQYGSLDLNGPQVPLSPSDPNDKTPAFNIKFQPVNGAVSSNISPTITGFNGKLYCLVIDNLTGGSTGYLYTKTPLLHINSTGKNEPGVAQEQEPPFSASVATLDCGIAQPALAVFETVDFHRDILPVLKTVTDYAYVNELAFDGHGPNSQANFVRSTFEASLGAPDTTNSGTRTHVFQFIRPGGWLTEVPPPPKDFDNSILPGGKTIVPPQENQQGTLMPHLAGTGGSIDENIFNNTQYPSQWLSLTRLQLDKFQKWVNGQFVTGKPIPTPKHVDKLPVAQQPDALDLAALELTVGGGFHPGIELTYYMAYPEYFCEPFRFTDEITYQGVSLASVTPGSIAGFMSIPWHGDFWSCNTDFWPPQRPDIVVKDIGGIPTTVNWFRSKALQIPETASSDPKWLHGANPGYFDGNGTAYQAFLRYWSYFGFVTTDGTSDEEEQVRIEKERDNTCLDGNNHPTCPPVNPVTS